MDFSFKKTDIRLLVSFIVLVVIGFAVLTSASQVLGFQKFGDSYHFVKQQSIHAVVGIVLFFLFYFFPSSYWKRFALFFYCASVVLLVLVFVPRVGASYGKNVFSWITFGGFGLQPAEFVKFAYILFLAYWFERKQSLMQTFAGGTVPFLVYSGILFTLVALQPDIGTLAVLMAVGVTMYFVSGAPKKYLVLLGTVAFLCLALLIAVAPYRLNRVMVFLNPSIDPQGTGYHAQQAVTAVGSGGIWGLGFGKSQSKFHFLPEAAGDSVFAVYAEELGLVFCLGLFILFGMIIVRGLRSAESAKSLFERYAATGIVVWISFQAFINIGAMIGLVPLTGVPLPFLSYGGSALVSEFAAMGFLLNVSKNVRL